MAQVDLLIDRLNSRLLGSKSFTVPEMAGDPDPTIDNEA